MLNIKIEIPTVEVDIKALIQLRAELKVELGKGKSYLGEISDKELELLELGKSLSGDARKDAFREFGESKAKWHRVQGEVKYILGKLSMLDMLLAQYDAEVEKVIDMLK